MKSGFSRVMWLIIISAIISTAVSIYSIQRTKKILGFKNNGGLIENLKNNIEFFTDL